MNSEPTPLADRGKERARKLDPLRNTGGAMTMTDVIEAENGSSHGLLGPFGYYCEQCRTVLSDVGHRTHRCNLSLINGIQTGHYGAITTNGATYSNRQEAGRHRWHY